MQNHGDGEAWLAVVGGGRKWLAWPFLLRGISGADLRGRAQLTDITSVYGYAGPLAIGCTPRDPFLADAWKSLADFWRRSAGVVTVFCRFHPLLENHRWVEGLSGFDCGAPAFDVRQLGQTVSLDLEQSEQASSAEYRGDIRNGVRRGVRAGLICGVDTVGVFLPDFVRLYHDTMRRRGARPEYLFSAEYFRALFEGMRPAISLHFVRVGEQLAAAGLISEYDGILQYLFSGTDERFVSMSPSKVLLDGVRQWGRSRGNRVFHLGGGVGGREDSLFYFKSGFSSRRHPFYVGQSVLDPVLYEHLCDKYCRAAWKADCTVDAFFFPGYRAPLTIPAAPEETAVRA
jgi:hypothetical protein